MKRGGRKLKSWWKLDLLLEALIWKMSPERSKLRSCLVRWSWKALRWTSTMKRRGRKLKSWWRLDLLLGPLI
jgi:hypothetical protein